MNIWHDIPNNRIDPEHFDAVIEISKGKKMKYELDKQTGMLSWTEFYIRQPIILQTMDLFLSHMRMTMTLLMSSFYVQRK